MEMIYFLYTIRDTQTPNPSIKLWHRTGSSDNGGGWGRGEVF